MKRLSSAITSDSGGWHDISGRRLLWAVLGKPQTLRMLYFAPPRPSPSSLLLSSTKEGEVLDLTPSNCMGPWCRRSSICVFFFMPGLQLGSSHVGRGLGSVRSFSGTKTLLTIRLELLCPGEGFSCMAFAFTRLDFDKEWIEDSDDFGDLRLQMLARVSFVSFVGRRPDPKQGNYLRTSQFRRSNPSWTVVSFIEWRPALQHGSCLHPSQFRPTDCFVWRHLRLL